MKVGDLVWGREHEEFINGDLVDDIGIVIAASDLSRCHRGVDASVVKVLWSNGSVDKEWTDELEVINESR